eukprot:3446450-Karenia_brevis.AAC.1
MITNHQELREEFNYADVTKWKRIETLYERGTLHYAVPHLFHRGIIMGADVTRLLRIHDSAVREFGSDLRKITIAQGRSLQQMVDSGFNNTMGSTYRIRFYEVRAETMMDEYLSSNIPYHDSRGLPKSVVPIGDPPMQMPNAEEVPRTWEYAVG